MILPALLSLLLAAQTQPAPAPKAPADSPGLCAAAIEAFNKGNLAQGFGMLDDASKAAPLDLRPREIRGRVLLALAEKVPPMPAAYCRERASDELEAVFWDPANTKDRQANIQMLLDAVHEGDYPDVGSPDPKALAAFQEAEKAFGARDFQKAREGYLKALTLDPAFVLPMLYLGDTCPGKAGSPEAIAWYRKAVDARPNYPRAWRYLSDAYGAAGDAPAVEGALIDAIAAHPGNRLSWLKLEQALGRVGRSLTRLAFDPPVRPHWDEAGKQTLDVPDHTLDPIAQAIWIPLVAGLYGDMHLEVKGGALPTSRFQQELFFWGLALDRLEAATRDAKQPIRDRILAQFLRFKKDGRLDAALFLLQYREAFRPDFEAWKKRNPQAIRAFIVDYGIRP
jgi:tetratricopeptide (TPR) repeat protein